MSRIPAVGNWYSWLALVLSVCALAGALALIVHLARPTLGMPTMNPCLNRTCPHPGAAHDIYEPGDPYPTCCVEGCECGHPGNATLLRRDGVITVTDWSPVIEVTRELLEMASPSHWDGETLTLDTAGEYRYQTLRRDPHNEHVLIFGRVKP